jgi:cell division protein FtsB
MAIASMAAQPRTSARSRRRAAGRPRRRRRLIEGVIIFAGCVVMIDALFGERGMVALMRARTESQALVQERAALQAENARLREEAERLLEPPAIEDEARRTLGLIKPGEKLFLIRDVTAADGSSGP